MAYDSCFPPISVHGTIVHCHAERLHGTLHYHFPCARLMKGASLPDVHDVSRGTKGADLGVVSAGKGKNKNRVEIALPTAETDINAACKEVVHFE